MENENKIIFGGFYRGYKHDPKKGFDNELYQVVNIARAKKGPKSGLIIYRPLQRSLVYLQGKNFDYKNFLTWHKPVKEKEQVIPRYVYINTVYEQFACKQLVKELYGTGEASLFGVDPTPELAKEVDRHRPIVANYSARTALLLVAEYGTNGVSETELVTAIDAIDSVVPMKNERFEITAQNIITNLVNDYELKHKVEKFKKPDNDEWFYRKK